MIPAWAQRREALVRDCVVSPDVFEHLVERLRAFVVPYQCTLETAAGKRSGHARVHRYGAIVLPAVGHGIGWTRGERQRESDGIIAFDSSNVPKRGIHSV